MSDLAEFLLARIAEDETDAVRDFGDDDTPGTWTRWVRAECEAKRRIIEIHHDVPVAPGRREITCIEDGAVTMPCETLRLLALPYADHPDYRQQWQP